MHNKLDLGAHIFGYAYYRNRQNLFIILKVRT